MFPADVELVQSLLATKGVLSGRPTGACDAQTIAAIKLFQQGFMRTPDGRVDRGGKTWTKLCAGTESKAEPSVDASAYRRLIPMPARDTLNPGVSSVNNALMTSCLALLESRATTTRRGSR